MKRLIIAGGLASLVAWAGAPAQAGQQTQDAKGKTVTLTGCLAKGETADSFVLNKATMAGDKGAATGTSGASGTTGAGEKAGAKDAQAAAYHLMPGKVEKMEAHVGHTVQITGTMEAMDKSKSYGGSGSTTTGTGAAAKDKPAMQHVTVTGMKHISGTCS